MLNPNNSDSTTSPTPQGEGLKNNSEETLASYLHKPEDLEQFSYETVIKTADKIENIFIDPKYIPDMLVDGSLELDLQ